MTTNRSITFLFIAAFLLGSSYSILFRANESLGLIFRYADKIILLGLATYLIIFFCVKKRHTIQHLSFWLPLSMGWAIISSLIFAQNLSGSFIQFFLTFQGFLALLLVINYNFSVDDGIFFSRCIIFIGLMTLLLATIEFFFPSTIKSFIHSDLIHEEAVIRASSLSSQAYFSHPGHLSWFMAFCFCLSYAGFLIFRTRKSAFLSAIFFIGIVITFRRKSLIAAIAVFLIGLIIIRRGTHSKVLLFLAAITFLLIITIIFGETLLFLASRGLETNNFLANYYVGPRVALTNTSLEISLDHFPFGSGLGTFGSWMSRENYSELYYHYGLNNYWGLSETDGRFLTDTFWPMIVAEIGILGAFSLAMLVIHIGKKCYKNIKLQDDKRNQYIALSAMLVFLEITLESFSSPSLSRSPQIFLAMFFIGLSISSLRSSNKQAPVKKLA